MSTPDMFGRVANAQTMRDVAPELMDILGAASSLPVDEKGAVGDGGAEYVFRLAGPTGIYGGTLEVFRNMIAQHALGSASRTTRHRTKRLELPRCADAPRARAIDLGGQQFQRLVGTAVMGEQHDLAESHLLQFAEAVDDGGRGADQAAFVETESGYPEALFGELSDAGQRCVVRCERHHRLDRQHDGGRVTPDVLAESAQHGDLVLESRRAHTSARSRRRRIAPPAAACTSRRRHPPRSAAGAAGPARFDRHVRHGEMLAREVDPLVGEGLMQDLQRLAQPLGPFGERAPLQADARVLVLDRAAADSQLKAARRDLVERGGHLREHGRMAKLVAQHHVSDLDALGAAEQRGGQGPRLHRRDSRERQARRGGRRATASRCPSSSQRSARCRTSS